jgi:hypothetical protein
MVAPAVEYLVVKPATAAALAAPTTKARRDIRADIFQSPF